MAIAKKISYQNVNPTFKTVVEYLTLTSEGENRVLSGKIYNCGLSLDGEFGPDDISRLYKAADIMKYVSLTNNRIEESPLLHYVVSFHPSDRSSLNKQDMLDICDYVVSQSNMYDCQCICCLHDDKRHLHMHIMLNRVKPGDSKVYEAWGDMFDLERIMREIEGNYGLHITEGKHYTFDGKDRRDFDEETMKQHLFEALLHKSLSKDILLFEEGGAKITYCRNVPIMDMQYVIPIAKKLDLDRIQKIENNMLANLCRGFLSESEKDLFKNSLDVLGKIKDVKMTVAHNEQVLKDFDDLYYVAPHLALVYFSANMELFKLKSNNEQSNLFAAGLSLVRRKNEYREPRSHAEGKFFDALLAMNDAANKGTMKEYLNAKIAFYDVSFLVLEEAIRLKEMRSVSCIDLRAIKKPNIDVLKNILSLNKAAFQQRNNLSEKVKGTTVKIKKKKRGNCRSLER